MLNVKLECSSCGAVGRGSCNCGVPYVRASTHAAKAIAATPQRSSRAIAAELGTSHTTVNRVRKSGGTNVPRVSIPKRVGRDGKAYSLPSPRATPPSGLSMVDLRDFHKAEAKAAHKGRGPTKQELCATGFLYRAQEALDFAEYKDGWRELTGPQYAKAARRAADAWNKVATHLERKLA